MIQSLSTFSIAHPQHLFALLLLLPAVFFIARGVKKISQACHLSKKLKVSIFLRTLMRSLAWSFSVLAFSGLFFGSKKIPVTKTGSNISLIFDISYSMLAKDAGNTASLIATKKTSRLEAVKIYVTSLLEKLSETSLSVTLAKGDGFLAVPETEDKETILSLVENLSPHLMTSGGSSLAKGIEAALNAIPQYSSKSQYIWIFTDGDETDNLLEKAIEKSLRMSVPVTVIGFGSEKECEITAGDGKTRVKTALRADKLKEISERVNKSSFLSVQKGAKCSFIEASAAGSAWLLLSQLKKNGNEGNSLSYEIKNVNRHSLLLFLSVIFLILSFIVSEGNFSALSFKTILSNSEKVLLLFIILLPFVSCSSEHRPVMKGVWAHYEGKYSTATADFLTVVNQTGNETAEHQYGLFDLSSVYLSIGEKDAALDRLEEMNIKGETLPPDLRSSALYNKGVIYCQKNDYEKAASFFKEAVIADPENISAKINLELCQREIVQKKANSGEAEMQAVNEKKADNSEMKSELFNLIRQNEGKKWRNMKDSSASENDVIDY